MGCRALGEFKEHLFAQLDVLNDQGVKSKVVINRELISIDPVPDEKGQLWSRQREGPTVTITITLTDPTIAPKPEKVTV